MKRVALTGDARWLARKTDVIASAFALNDASMVVESGNSRIRLYMGNTVWCIGLGRSGEDGPYYPQSLRKGNAAKEKMPGTQIHHVVSIKYLNTAQCHPSIQD